MSKKSQLQIGESIIVLIILIFIAIIIIVFAVKNEEVKFEERLTKFEELNTLEVMQATANLFELKCSKPGLTDICFDIHKAQALSKLRKNNPELVQSYFQDLFSNSKVTLKEIYPGNQKFTLYWKNASNEPGTQTSTKVAIPVPIENSSKDTVSFGLLEIERYFKARGIR